DGLQLSEQLINSGATFMQATPATWRILLTAGWKSSTQLKIFCGGEALTWELANQLLERSSELWNLYGPTETTIWSDIYQINTFERGNYSQGAVVSIGKPIANTRIYILDSYDQPLPPGIPGELCIAG